MKMIFRLLCGWMVIALAACTGDELQQIEPLQKPVAQKTISVKAYTPSEQAATRLAFEDKGAEGLKLSWTAGDAFTAVIGEGVTFTYDTENGEFTADVNENFELSNGTIAYYPAYDGENFEMDFSRQTGQLNGATTYMEGVYSNGAFRFTHSTAILKATFSCLPQNAVISSIQISGAVDITITNYNSSDAAYINLPAIPKDGQLKFMVETATGDVYTATKTVRAEEGIKTGVYYNTTVELQEACLLPTGIEFNSAISTVDGYGNATSIVFEANVADETPATRSDSNYTIALAGNVLTISTPLSEFVFNADCNSMFASLFEITAINFYDCINTAKVTNMSYMFNNCSSLTSLDLSSFNFDRVTDFSGMFTDLGKNAVNKPIPVYVTQAGYDILMNESTGVDGSNAEYALVCELPTGSRFNSAVNSFLNGKSLTKIKFVTNSDNTDENNQIGTSGAYMVANGETLEIHTSAAQFMFNEDCSSMFADLSNITAIDFNDCVNTAKVTTMSYMFFYCSALTSLDLSSFDFKENVVLTNMFLNLGSEVTNKPISVYVKDENDKDLFESKSTGINSNYAQIVVKQP